MAGTDKVRTHVLLPRKLLDAIDHLVSQRRRSTFLNVCSRCGRKDEPLPDISVMSRR
jgi:hypothetical protein